MGATPEFWATNSKRYFEIGRATRKRVFGGDSWESIEEQLRSENVSRNVIEAAKRHFIADSPRSDAKRMAA